MSSPQWVFDRFYLDLDRACLWNGAEVVTLSPKAFDVLHYLVTHPNRLVTKDELLEAVWPATAVSDAVVRVAIGTLRKVLGDTAHTPRFIATVSRRGYRFLAPVSQSAPTEFSVLPASPTLPLLSPSRPLVEREEVLQSLEEAWGRARQGRRQVVWVTGEAGIGKTAVVDALRARVATDPMVWTAVGQCVEHYGTGEPYLPVLEAVGQLCRSPNGARLVALLRQHAPTWLFQMPWLLTEADRMRLPQEIQGATQERMLREFADVIDILTVETALLLLLEDLHWSDDATLDLLALLARRHTPARLFVVGTYRPGEALVLHHPLHPVLHDLQQNGDAMACPLAVLSVEAVAAYLVACCPQHQFPTTLAPWLHQRTDGNPLFLVTLVQTLVERDILHAADGCWTLPGGLEALAREVPESLRRMLEQQITRLPPASRHVLEVASAAGVEFVTSAVAASLGADAAAVEERCEALVEQQILHPLGATTWPNGTVATRYAFQHALYQQVVYERLGAGRRVRLHQRLGEELEAAYGAQAGEVAAELAEHFERGYNVPQAVHYLQQAAEKATRRYAHREVVALLTRALALLRQLPETPGHIQQELALQIALGASLLATKGYAAPEVAQTYSRARQLCHHLEDPQQLFPVLRGLWNYYQGRAELQTAQALSAQLLTLAQQTRNPAMLPAAHRALGSTLLFLGAPVAAHAHLAQAIALYDAQQHCAATFLYGDDAGVVCRSRLSWALWYLGYPDQGLALSAETLTLAQQMASPFSLGFALSGAALLHQLRREGHVAQEYAETAICLAMEQGFPYWRIIGSLLCGWVLALQGQAREGLEQLHQGLTALRATGSEVLRPYFLALLAAGYATTGQPAAGLTELAEALTLAEKTAERWYTPEIHRLKGELLLQQSLDNHAEAQACFHRALNLARHQQARSLELRAAMSLAQLWQQQDKYAAAYQLLTEVYGWFTEGFDTADMREARTLLDTLG